MNATTDVKQAALQAAATGDQASTALARLRALLTQATLALAHACSKDGKLNAGKLDVHQSTSFELAWASAELLAAETGVKAITSASSALDTRLALLFAVEAGTSVISRLETLFIEFPEAGESGLPALAALSSSREWLELRRIAGGEAALTEAGRMFADAHGELADLELPEQLAMARDSFRRFAADVVAPQAEHIHRHDLTVPETLLEPLREMGVFGLSIPERFGGIGPDDRDDTLMMVVVTEALSEASLAAAGSLITRPEILSRALMTGGTEEQKTHWLPKIAVGEPLCAIAITEPDYGSDVAGLSLKATRVDGGWKLNGAKTWCTFAGKAGLLMVVARTNADKSLGHKGLSLILVEKPSYEGHDFDYKPEGGGRLVGKAIPTIGYRGMHSFDLAFEDFFVPDANVIGGVRSIESGKRAPIAGRRIVLR